jgi:uncharacterized protein (TIGR03067 family)
MYRVCVSLLLSSLLLPSLTGAADEADLDKLQGDWRKVESQVDGNAEAADTMPSVRIRDDKVRLLQNGNEQEGIELKLKLDAQTNPRLIDIVLPDGQTLEGIYKLEAGRWTICIRSEAGVKDRPTTFESKPGSKLILAVFEKAP